MATQSMDTAPKEEIQVRQSKESGLVQMKSKDYVRIKQNFELLKAKYLDSVRRNNAMQNLYSQLSSKDDELNIYKTRAHKYEVAYIRAETKLTNMCMKLREQSGNKSLDILAILKALEIDAKDINGSNLHTNASISLRQHDASDQDIEIDCDNPPSPHTRNPPTLVETLRSRDIGIGHRHQASEIHNEPSYVMRKVIEENKVLKSKITDFSKDHSTAWENFKAHDEQVQLIEELRLELARVQVQNHELRLLLQAEDHNNEEALRTKLTDYMSKDKRLEKQIASMRLIQTALHTENKRLKQDHKDLLGNYKDLKTNFGLVEGQSALRSFGDGGYESTPEPTKELSDKIVALESQVKTLEKNNETINQLEQAIENLKKEIDVSNFQVEELTQVIDTLKSTRTTMDDQPITMSLLREENEKLKNRLQLYGKEHEEDKQTKGVLEGQLSLVQRDYDELRARLQSLDVQNNLKLREELLSTKNKHDTLLKANETVMSSFKHAKFANKKLQEQFNSATLKCNDAEKKVRDLESRAMLNRPALTSFNVAQHHSLNHPTSYEYPQPINVPDSGRLSAGRRSNSPYSNVSMSSDTLLPLQTNARYMSPSLPTPLRSEVADGDDNDKQQYELDVIENKFTCERCLREFELHEKYKFDIHVKKCQD